MTTDQNYVGKEDSTNSAPQTAQIEAQSTLLSDNRQRYNLKYERVLLNWLFQKGSITSHQHDWGQVIIAVDDKMGPCITVDSEVACYLLDPSEYAANVGSIVSVQLKADVKRTGPYVFGRLKAFNNRYAYLTFDNPVYSELRIPRTQIEFNGVSRAIFLIATPFCKMSELMNITTDEQGLSVVSSLIVADGLDIQHKNLLETIRTHKEVIERDFGLIAFETRKTEPGKGRPETIAYLTENQAVFISTLSRNSKRVVEFKSALVQSFAEARKRLLAPAPTTEQVLIQLMSQQNQLMASQSELLAQLWSDVNHIMTTGQKPARTHRALGKQLSMPGLPKPRFAAGTSALRQLIHAKIVEYCDFHDATPQETYNYLYKRLFDVYSINAYRLTKVGNESLLDALERYGHLDRMYGLIMVELTYTEE